MGDNRVVPIKKNLQMYPSTSVDFYLLNRHNPGNYLGYTEIDF